MNAAATQVEDYAAGVRAALADLPAAARDELLADLPEHLGEVAAENPGEPLADRLGPPESYAADLRAAAGLPAADTAPRARHRTGWADLADRPWVRATTGFLPELLPGWWVLRGLLAAFMLTVWGAGGVAVWVLLGVPAAVGSVLLGRRAQDDERWRVAEHLLSIATAVVAVFALFVAASATTGPTVSGTGYDPGYGAVDGTPGLSGVTNLYVYGPDGKPVQDAQVFDQDGRPIVLESSTDAQGNVIVTVPRYDPGGRVVPNVFPQEQTVADPALPDAAGNPTVHRVTPPAVRPATLAPR